jgi:hypothetical protein
MRLHPLRKRLIAALRHSSEPLGAGRIEDEYLDGEPTDLGTIVYDLGILEQVSVVELADPPDGEGTDLSSPVRGVALGGDNAGEAVRRLEIADGRDP